MCELFGASFNKNVRINFSFNAFRQRGRTWRDGWGLAWYPDESCQIIKEEKPAIGSKMAQFLKDNDRIKSKIFIIRQELDEHGNYNISLLVYVSQPFVVMTSSV